MVLTIQCELLRCCKMEIWLLAAISIAQALSVRMVRIESRDGMGRRGAQWGRVCLQLCERLFRRPAAF